MSQQAVRKQPTCARSCRNIMQNFFGVFRRGDFMKEGIEKLRSLRGRIENQYLEDKSEIFNTARIEALELENLLKWHGQRLLLPKGVMKVAVLMLVRISLSVMMQAGFAIPCFIPAARSG